MNVDQGKYYFPNGCNLCGGEVQYKSLAETFGVDKEGMLFICSSCGAYTSVHKITKGEAVQGEPTGILADLNLRNLHDLLRCEFSKLWMIRPNEVSPLVKNLFPEYLIEFREGLGVVKDIDREKKLFKIEDEDGFMWDVPINETHQTKPRTKSYYWLSKQMGIKYIECKIPFFDEEQTYQAIEIIKQAIKPFENATNN